MGSPRTRDNKSIVTVYPASEGWHSWFTSAGDAIDPPQRGGGERIRLTWTAAEPRGEKVVDLRFIEPVEVHDGEAFYQGDWSADDLLNFSLQIPATVTTPNPGGTGNCNRVPTGLGYDLIVPASGDGAHDVDLAQAAPVPAPGTGFWDVNHETGAITPAATPGQADWLLLSVPAPAAYFVRNLCLGSPLGVWDIDTYKVEWLHPSWTLRLAVNKQSDGAGDFSGWILTYRRKVT
jgi:hypothetical protein